MDYTSSTYVIFVFITLISDGSWCALSCLIQYVIISLDAPIAYIRYRVLSAAIEIVHIH